MSLALLLVQMTLFVSLLSFNSIEGRRKEPALSKLDKMRHDFLELEEKLWYDLDSRIGNEVKFPEVDLITKFEAFDVGQIQKEMVQDISEGLQESLASVWIWQMTNMELKTIRSQYESFRRFQRLQTAINRIPSPQQAWLDLVQTFMNSSNSIVDSQENIAIYISKDNLFKECLKEIEGDMRCNTKQSPQQVLFNLYKSIALTELKGYMMMQFSYMLLKLYNKGNFTKEASIMKERYAERTTAAIQSVKEAMADASREFWRCDPQKHVLNESYIEITNLLQGYVQNEVDLNPEGTCRENCAYYSYTKSHSCYQNLYCQQQRRCNGRIIDCQFIDSDAWVCPADVKSGRRYEYIEYENGRTLGRKQGCPKGPVKVDSWWRWLFWHCSYCFCLCDEESVYSDRYINMRSAIADVVNNRVVTGLRFVKNNRIIHLQIQEGKLLPGGEIDVTTIHWVPVENYRITDKNTFNGQDYHTLTSTEREIDLDDLIADDGHVLTGVRFKKVGQHLNFEIYITPFNFSSGQLIDPLHMSVWKDNLISSRKVLNMEKMDVPIRSPLPSVPDSKSQQVLQFTHTDMDRDASQTTVPFIDAQPVELMIPVPLAGAGIYHKGRPHFGGFIAPKIITYDYSKHLQAGFPEDAEKVH
ncbi:uncharacterized protein LOC108734901 isoform X3 [Agrilus planipennis]|uniref:Uncharacterized protein LOC108734901 isoform X3 n=1 Tax=Agrilus planipennis TaxID=224129 RepID=A0A1W4WPX4_AGRPL|nr:uncharacterized protein LOC108734901 isoform X3 [Agrilus planipennis]